jgi:hypothetical protein
MELFVLHLRLSLIASVSQAMQKLTAVFGFVLTNAFVAPAGSIFRTETPVQAL